MSYALYQAAVIHKRMWQITGNDQYREGLEFLKEGLTVFQRRWFVATKYLDLLESESLPLPFSFMGPLSAPGRLVKTLCLFSIRL